MRKAIDGSMTMKTFITYGYLLLVVVFFTGADSAPPRPSRSALILPSVHVKGENWFYLGTVEATAISILRSNTNFPKEPPAPAVWVDPGNSKEFVKVHYGPTIGKPYWSVSFGVDGRPISYEHGILGEGSGVDFEKKPVK